MIHVTDIGEKIAFHKDDNEYNQALIKAVNNIPLWHILYEKYTNKEQDVPDAEFWLDIKDSCDLTIEQAKNLAADVRNAFKEDIKNIRIIKPLTSSMSQNQGQTQQPKTDSVPEGSIPIGFGDVKVILPKEKTAEAWNKLKAMVDAFIKS